MDGNILEEGLNETIKVSALMEFISQFDGRFSVCFVDSKNNMIPLRKEDISLRHMNILLPDHSHVKDVYAVVVKHPKEKKR